jgi:hypothetical protein
MEKINSLKTQPFNINPKNNRFVLKLFGEMDHDYITIEKDDTLTISKVNIDNFEKKGQISKWQFNLDRIYTQETTFDELYENEIENTDYLHEFNKMPQHRTLTFIGDKNDSLTDMPYKEFIIKCIKECLDGIKQIQTKFDNNTNNGTLTPIISFCELNKSFAVDYLKENNTNNLNNTENNVISKPKLNKYEDDLVIEGLSQIQISNENEFISLLNLAKKNYDNFKSNYLNNESKKESSSQIITIKLFKSNTNECFSKINFVLYKAYEILDEEEDSNKHKNSLYTFYTKDNYNFFKGIKNKINFRLSYVIKYLRDTLIKGNNLFIIALPCEYQYLQLLYDLLDDINMRKIIIENFLLNESEDEIESTNNIGEIYKFENVSVLNWNENNIKDDDSFPSFSKNNSVITNVSSILDSKVNNFLYNSYIDNKSTEGKKRRKEINYDRLRKINDKDNIINLFNIFDKLSQRDSGID